MGSILVEAQVDINRSPEDVFDYCSDPIHEPECNPMMKRVVKLTDGPVGVGARYATEFVGAPPMVMECIDYEHPSAWSLKGDSRVLTAVGDGRVVLFDVRRGPDLLLGHRDLEVIGAPEWRTARWLPGGDRPPRSGP